MKNLLITIVIILASCVPDYNNNKTLYLDYSVTFIDGTKDTLIQVYVSMINDKSITFRDSKGAIASVCNYKSFKAIH